MDSSGRAGQCSIARPCHYPSAEKHGNDSDNLVPATYLEYVATIEWTKQLGVKLEAGRTRHYERVLRHWKDAYRWASVEEGRETFPDFVSSMTEIHAFVAIHASLRGVKPDQLTRIAEKLQKGVNGPANAIDETSASTAARNFLFEVEVAARAHRPERGVESIFNARSDTGIRVGDKKLWIECKRVASADKLERNLSKACDQLGEVLRDQVGSGHRGIVAMDVSKLLNRGDMIYVGADDQRLLASVQHMMDSFISQHYDLWARVYARKNSKIIGTLFRIAFMATSEARNILVHSTQWGLSPSPRISQADFDTLKHLAATLDSGG